jgi:hypothetical protein
MQGDYYDTMQVCTRWGHQITAFYDASPEARQQRCSKCGSRTIHTCQYCGANIRGYRHMQGVVSASVPQVPLNCYQCGRAYPWKTKHLIRNFLKALVAPLKYLIDAVVSIFKK